MNLGQKIFKQYRKEIKATQEQYAGMWGISQPTVHLIETGKAEPKASIILSILKKRGQEISDPA